MNKVEQDKFREDVEKLLENSKEQTRILEELIAMEVVKSPWEKNKKQSKRVESWIYTIINFVLEDVIPLEVVRLSEGNYTWHSDTRECNYLYILNDRNELGRQGPILDDFIQNNPQSAPYFATHDSLMRDINIHAGNLFDFLRESEEFIKKMNEALRLVDVEEGVNFALAIVENVINNHKDLPVCYAISDAWIRYGEDLKKLAPRDLVLQLSQAGKRLISHNGEMAKHLRELRTRLCDEYDIPAAPCDCDNEDDF